MAFLESLFQHSFSFCKCSLRVTLLILKSLQVVDGACYIVIVEFLFDLEIEFGHFADRQCPILLDCSDIQTYT